MFFPLEAIFIKNSLVMERKVMKNTKSCFTTVSAVILTSLFLLAVMGTFSDSYAKSKKLGSLDYNAAIITKFGSSATLPTNFDVYFYGPADRPDAVIAIIKGTPFDANIWRPIAMEAEEIGKWRYLIETYNDLLMDPYWGYDMLDPDGKMFGKWISTERRAIIKMTKDNKITVYTPNVQQRASTVRAGY
jgi:hypothetical protein